MENFNNIVEAYQFAMDNYVIIPKTFAASCYWGKGTSWDTAHRIQGERYFDYYSNMSPLYIFVNKQTGEKYQYFMGFDTRYFLTMSATLNTIASSNSRRSRPVSFLIFSSL